MWNVMEFSGGGRARERLEERDVSRNSSFSLLRISAKENIRGLQSEEMGTLFPDEKSENPNGVHQLHQQHEDVDAGALFVLKSKGSWLHCGYHLSTSIVAPTLLSLPYAFTFLGWTAGISCLVIGALVTFYSYNLISRVLEHHAQNGKRQLRFRDMARDILDEDMWVALGLICRKFARLELHEVEENICKGGRKHLQSVVAATFRVLWCDDDDRVVLVVRPGASSGGGGLLRTSGEDGGDARV
ncbi:hypothetical protein V8G54_022832 [Vigna mungo]|uniref:Amino acid transporter transmembrane domain-containing protein n=1 Tax=Vigna mungo TaxID=3915 RepID=A0AAQ3RS05_VIGMU